MHKNNDINQVSMSSIEPAAVSATNNHAAATSATGKSNASKKSAKSGRMKVSAKKINETSENEDSEVEPTSENDLQENRIDVNDIPEFTIGPGALGAKGSNKESSLLQEEGLINSQRDENFSLSPEDKHDQAPFKKLTNGGKLVQQLKIDPNNSNKKNQISPKPPQVIKQNQIQLKSNRQNGKDMKKQGDKRTLLKKNVFESDMGLSTGRFVGQVEDGTSKIHQHLSKSANQAKALKAINDSASRIQDSSPVGKVEEFDNQVPYDGEPTSPLENEMRETSYFKQQTDDESAARETARQKSQANQNEPQSLSELISITNQSQQHSTPLPSGSNIASTSAASTGHAGLPKNLSIKQNNSQLPPNRKLSRQGSNSGEDKSDTNSQISKSKQLNKEGVQMFKVSSRSQMRQRAQRASGIKKSEANPSLRSSSNRRIEESLQLTPLSPTGGSKIAGKVSIGAASNISGSQGQETPSASGYTKMARAANRENQNTAAHGLQKSGNSEMYEEDQILRSQSHNPQHLISGVDEDELHIDDDDDYAAERVAQNLQEMDALLLGDNVTPLSSTNKSQQKQTRKVKVSEKDLSEIQRVHQQNEKHITANFGALNLQKQQKSNQNRNNYSALKGGPDGDEEILEADNASEGKDPATNSSVQNQMFTSMSDIGFPANIHKYNLKVDKQKERVAKDELITTEQIQRMMDTQNNWRVRTKTIDEMLHDVQERTESDPEYMMVNSERFLDFFLQLLTDQNFKIVLNTLNILNMIIWMPQQVERYEKLLKLELPQDESWGLSNAILGRHIPLIVKKLADSKNIIRQEAIKCLFGINEIMRRGSKKDNNFIALILPYLNNSSNWHIREELLHLLIKCFLSSQDQNEFDSFQILDSIVRLFNDTKEKIRNLALEAIAAFSSIGERSKISEVLFQLNVEKDICELVQSRLEYGLFPTLTQDGNIEIPYQDHFNNNYDVDSVAHSVTNQTQISANNHKNYQGGQEYNSRRKQSVGVSSQKGSAQAKMRGNSSGRKIVVATANATNQQLGVSHQDEIMQQAYIQSKRTASANNPNQFEFENQNFLPHGPTAIPDHNPANSFSYSVGGNTGNKGGREQRFLPQFDEMSFPQDLNGSSFLPKLQKVVSYNEQQNSSQSYQRERVVGSSGGPSMGYMGLGPGNLDPNLLAGQIPQSSMPISGGNKRSNKYLHGTPGHPHNHQAHFSQQNGTNLQNQFSRGNSGKILGNHPMNNSISNKSPSLYDQNTTLFDMSGNVGSLFGGENVPQPGQSRGGAGGRSGQGGHVKHMSNLGGGVQMPYPVTQSEVGGGEHDFLSIAGAHPNHHQTPSSFNQDQILYSAGGYRGSGDHGDFDGANSSFNLGVQGLTPDSMQMANQSNQGRESGRNFSKGNAINSGHLSQHPATANSQNVSELIADASPSHQSHGSHINVIDGGFSQTPVHGNQQSNSQHQQRGQHKANGSMGQGDGAHPQHPSSKKQNNQNTFYSDGTTFTGITATTGATSQNRGMTQKNKILLLKGAGPPQHNIQTGQPGDNSEARPSGQSSANFHRGPGPVKATRAFANHNEQQEIAQDPSQGYPDQQQAQDLCIDNRKPQGARGLKIKTRAQEQSRDSRDQGSSKLQRNDSNDFMRQSRDSHEIGQLDDQQSNGNRSFSYHQDSRQGSKANLNVQQPEILSAGIKRSHFGGGGDKLNQQGEDPALLTQSSKIVYVATEDLEPLKKPEKEFKKSTTKKQGIWSDDWFEQFEACNIIRRVCKHHQSLILQTGNQLQGLVGILIKLADSLRSAVSRIALITLNEMFQSLKRVMEPSLDPIIKILLKKGTDTSHFVAQEADKCLVSLVHNCQESKVLQILLMQNAGSNSRSNVYRLKMCQCLQNIVKSLGNNILFFKENDKLLIQLAKYLQDASQDVRQQAKIAFVSMSQAIMGQNELEKLLQRVLNEVQYKKVKEFLDKEPTHLIANHGSQIDFVITNANNQNQQMLSKKMPNKQHQQSFKTLSIKHNGLMQKNVVSDQQYQDQPLNIQAKSIINPQLAKQESSGFLTKIAQQNVQPQARGSTKQQKNFGEDGAHDQFFIDSAKDAILKTQVNEWRLRHEAAEQLFELIKSNIKKFQSRGLKMVELADALCKLLTDSNAKIQIYSLDSFNKIFPSIFPFVLNHIQLFYKSIISNLGSSNVGVRKNTEQILKQINDSVVDKQILLQPLANMIQYNSNARLKPALIDQLIDLLDHIQDLTGAHQKYLLPVSFKLLDDNKNEVKQRTERLLKKLYSMIGQQVLDQCPQIRLQRVCDICLKMSMSGTNSSGKHSQGGRGTTGGFGANGNQLHLNSRM